MDLFGSFVIACSMYSRIPMPQVDWTENRMKYAMCFFPLIGVIMGAALWLTALIGENVHTLEEGSLLWAVMGTILPLLITGGIHLDGYLDVTDARSSYGDRAKKLEILKDPHIGAFAVIGCGIYLLAYAGFFSLIPGKALPLIGGYLCVDQSIERPGIGEFPKSKKRWTGCRIFRRCEKTSGNFDHEHLSGFDSCIFMVVRWKRSSGCDGSWSGSVFLAL